MSSIRKQFLRNVFCLSLLLCSFVAVQHFAPMPMEMVPPEHGALATGEKDAATARAFQKCKDLPAGALPGGVVLEWKDERGVVYSEERGDVSMAFDIAVGVLTLPKSSLLNGFTLCK